MLAKYYSWFSWLAPLFWFGAGFVLGLLVLGLSVVAWRLSPHLCVLCLGALASGCYRITIDRFFGPLLVLFCILS